MVEYAEAECATCHAIRPKNEMREVKVRRTTAKSYASSQRTGQSNNRHNSYGKSGARFGSGSTNSASRRSSSQTHQRIDREWICLGCKAPSSDLPPGAIQTGLAAATVLGLLGYNYLQPTNNQPRPASAQPVVEAYEGPVKPAIEEPSQEVTGVAQVERAPNVDRPIDVAPAVSSIEASGPPSAVGEAPSAPQTYEEYSAAQDPAFQEQVARTKAAREASEKEAAEIERKHEEELQRAAAALGR